MKRKIMIMVLASLLVLAMGTSAFAAIELSSAYSGSVVAGGTSYMGGSVTADGFTPLSMRDANATAYYDTFVGGVAYHRGLLQGGHRHRIRM